MYLRAFATLFVTFWRERSGVEGAKTTTGLVFVVSHSCLAESNTDKGTARMVHRAFLAAATIFRIFSCIVFALRRTNSIVRLWVLIACTVGRISFARLVVCFVGFRGGAENWGA